MLVELIQNVGGKRWTDLEKLSLSDMQKVETGKIGIEISYAEPKNRKACFV
jgi:hypothetical protein